MNNPLISVVIPTCARPDFVQRSVRSALENAGDDIEVIVVPNGPDQSYRKSLIEFAADQRVRVQPIEIAHGNVARNYGMQLARGKYLRFLDDDDYLLAGARGQLHHIEGSSYEICSGLLSNMDQSGKDLGTVGFPESHDFVCAAVTVSGFTLPTGNIFLRSALEGCYWDPKVNRAQDYCWMLDLAAKREWSWTHFPQTVGVWFQHDSPRVSTTSPLRSKERCIVRRITALYEMLSTEERIEIEHRQCIAASLWYYIHRGFPYHPCYWSQVARAAEGIFPAARPPVNMYRHGILASLDPVLAEWLTLPARCLTQLCRRTLARIYGPEYRRRL